MVGVLSIIAAVLLAQPRPVKPHRPAPEHDPAASASRTAGESR
jgi:hypothetical protein